MVFFLDSDLCLYFYNNIKYLREIRGLSRSRFAKLIGVDYDHVLSWEKQKYQPSAFYCLKICIVLDVSFQDLFFFSEVAWDYL